MWNAPKAMNGPRVTRPGCWVYIPKLGLHQLSSWVVEAAQVCDYSRVVAAQRGTRGARNRSATNRAHHEGKQQTMPRYKATENFTNRHHRMTINWRMDFSSLRKDIPAFCIASTGSWQGHPEVRREVPSSSWCQFKNEKQVLLEHQDCNWAVSGEWRRSHNQNGR
jgi:hypothetical protein